MELLDIDEENASKKVARNLSGGFKRKLAVCLAFIGDPKVIVLDEPSSGMVSDRCLCSSHFCGLKNYTLHPTRT